MKRKFIQSTMSAGQVTGLIAAQSIVDNAYLKWINIRKLSQLLTFNCNKAESRISINNEDSNYAKCQVYFEEGCAAENDLDHTREKLIQMECRRLRDIVLKVEIYFDPNPRETVISEDQEFVEDWWAFGLDEYSPVSGNSIPFTVRLTLDRGRKEYFSIRNQDIQEIITEKYWDRIMCLFNNDNAEKLAIHLRFSPYWLDCTNRILYEARKKQQRKENISDEAMNVLYNDGDFPTVGGSMNDDESDSDNSDDDDDGRDNSMAYADIIRHLSEFTNNLMDEVELRGIKGVEKIMMSELNKYGNKTGKWHLDIQYTGYQDRLRDNNCNGYRSFMSKDEEKEFRIVNNPLLNLMNVHVDGVDYTRIQTDCIKDIYDIFGIEASRAWLIENMKQLFHNRIDIRHLMLVAEKITFDGTLRGLEQVDRYGDRENSDILSPLMKCSTSNNSGSCVPSLLQAATFGIEDNVNECTDKRIMFGKNYRGGTGSFDIFGVE